MILEFTRHGKTYQSAIAVPTPRPATITIIFRPCPLKAPFQLELAFLGTDELRGIELYQPVREIYQ
jgi:hypothetical protein